MAKRNSTAKKDMTEAEILTSVVDENIEATETTASEYEAKTVSPSMLAKVTRVENETVWVSVNGNGYIISKESIPDYAEPTVGQTITILSGSIAAGR